ncbi:hypothetical protein [Plantibacter sp. YIM 135249]|uniref:hypothetical protein n=1 Tax=Plantibacter sp. YIM 135249 TaxID=3423918 RepID=UPI003D330D0C
MTIAPSRTPWSTRVLPYRLPIALALVSLLLVIARSLGGNGDYSRDSVHYVGSDASSLAALLNPSLATAALWSACSIFALAWLLLRRGAGPLATAALTLCLVVSPLAWDAFRPGSPFALSILSGLALFQATMQTLGGRRSPVWVGGAVAIAVLANTSNLLGALVVLAACTLALLPWFRPPQASVLRILSVLGAAVGGGAIALTGVRLLAPPLTGAVTTEARPLTLPDIAEQIRMPFEGGIVATTADFGIAPSYPFHFALTVGLWWIVTGGAIAAAIVGLSDRRTNALSSAVVVTAVVGGTSTVVVLTALTGAGFDLDGLATASLVPMFLLATGSVARNRAVNLTITAACGALLCALLIWSVTT